MFPSFVYVFFLAFFSFLLKGVIWKKRNKKKNPQKVVSLKGQVHSLTLLAPPLANASEEVPSETSQDFSVGGTCLERERPTRLKMGPRERGGAACTRQPHQGPLDGEKRRPRVLTRPSCAARAACSETFRPVVFELEEETRVTSVSHMIPLAQPSPPRATDMGPSIRLPTTAASMI